MHAYVICTYECVHDFIKAGRHVICKKAMTLLASFPICNKNQGKYWNMHMGHMKKHKTNRVPYCI